MSTDLAVLKPVREFPTVLPGNDTPRVRKRVQTFYLSVASLFERWIARSGNKNTGCESQRNEKCTSYPLLFTV